MIIPEIIGSTWDVIVHLAAAGHRDPCFTDVAPGLSDRTGQPAIKLVTCAELQVHFPQFL